MTATSEEEAKLEASILHNGKVANWDSQVTWNDLADLYDLVIGRTTMVGARRLVELANERLPFEVGDDSTPSEPALRRRVVDLGAGTGSVSLTLAERFPALDILAVDISAGMLKHLSAKWHKASASSPSSVSIRTQVADISVPLISTAQSRDSSSTDGGSTVAALSRSLAGSFSHTASLAVIQATSNNLGCIQNMWELLAPGGCCALGCWDFENEFAVYDVWALAATAADPAYKAPPVMPPGRWTGMAELEAAMRQVGFVDLRKEIYKCRMPLDNGTEDLIRWYFESKNPAASERLSTFHGDRGILKREMRKVLDEQYEKGTKLIMDIDIVIGTKPA